MKFIYNLLCQLKLVSCFSSVCGEAQNIKDYLKNLKAHSEINRNKGELSVGFGASEWKAAEEVKEEETELNDSNIVSATQFISVPFVSPLLLRRPSSVCRRKMLLNFRVDPVRTVNLFCNFISRVINWLSVPMDRRSRKLIYLSEKKKEDEIDGITA